MKKHTLVGLFAILSVLLCLLVTVGCTADPTPAETTEATEATPTDAPTEAPTDPATEAPTEARCSQDLVSVHYLYCSQSIHDKG